MTDASSPGVPDNRGNSPLHQPVAAATREAEARKRADPGHTQKHCARWRGAGVRATSDTCRPRRVTRGRLLIHQRVAADPHYGESRAPADPASSIVAEPRPPGRQAVTSPGHRAAIGATRHGDRARRSGLPAGTGRTWLPGSLSFCPARPTNRAAVSLVLSGLERSLHVCQSE